MFKFIIVFAGLFLSIHLQAQTGIGTTTPHTSAKLDVSATNKGFLPPRVTLTSNTDATTIPSPAEGLLVYNLGSVGLQAGYYYWNNANWATIATATSAGNGVTASDMVKLYGEAHSKSTGKIGNSTTGFVFSVPVSGRYLFDFTSAATTLYGGTNTIYFTVRQGATVLASDMQSSYNNNVHVEYNGKVEVNLQAGVSYNVYNYATSGSFETSDYDRVYYKLVAGNLPVTGQSVDYIQASLSTNQALATVGNINFNTSSGTGITITSGGFNLIANKTYKLEAAIGGASGGYAYYGWVDNSNNLLPGGSIGAVIKAGNAHTDAPQDKAVVYFTPTVDTRVFLRVYNLSGALTAYAPSLSTNFSSTWASIQQIGSSAFVNPWTLSGTNTYNTTGNVSIGTSTPNASAILDISSSSKGVLPPKVVLTGRNGTSLPIASPTTGLFVYNTAEAGTVPNEVSPGFYFFNGTNWTRMDPEDWSISESITIGAVTSAPTKGTIVYDKVSYRRTSTTSFEVTYNYSQSTAGTAGSGHYLFRLPGNLTFGSSVLKTTSNTYETIVNRVIIGTGYYGDASGRFRPLGIIPYDNNRFRIMVMDNNFAGLIIGSSDIGLNADGSSYKFSFILETN